MHYLLDTDHVTILQQRGDAALRLTARLQSLPPGAIATSIISFQEQVLGWLSFLNKARAPEKIVEAYEKLEGIRRTFAKLNVFPFNADAQARFSALRQQKVRVPTLDLRIACIALATDSVLLSRNLKDFRQIPGLRVEDWTI
jgi:tRNA(fMet)-specific endonuclease VapC